MSDHKYGNASLRAQGSLGGKAVKVEYMNTDGRPAEAYIYDPLHVTLDTAPPPPPAAPEPLTYDTLRALVLEGIPGMDKNEFEAVNMDGDLVVRLHNVQVDPDDGMSIKYRPSILTVEVGVGAVLRLSGEVEATDVYINTDELSFIALRQVDHEVSAEVTGGSIEFEQEVAVTVTVEVEVERDGTIVDREGFTEDVEAAALEFASEYEYNTPYHVEFEGLDSMDNVRDSIREAIADLGQ